MLAASASPETGIPEDNLYECILESGPDDLFARAAFRIWIPEDVERLRGIILHQHGCGRNGLAMPWD